LIVYDLNPNKFQIGFKSVTCGWVHCTYLCATKGDKVTITQFIPTTKQLNKNLDERWSQILWVSSWNIIVQQMLNNFTKSEIECCCAGIGPSLKHNQWAQLKL
jgi:hypothetical protein